eukprot:2258993-Rhodomonas_salina.9
MAYRHICLRVCYAMSGIDMAYRPICLRACYTMSGALPRDYSSTPRNQMQEFTFLCTAIAYKYARNVRD